MTWHETSVTMAKGYLQGYLLVMSAFNGYALVVSTDVSAKRFFASILGCALWLDARQGHLRKVMPHVASLGVGVVAGWLVR